MQLIVLKGLPASGKTTWAREHLGAHPGSFIRVNKDDIRAMLYGETRMVGDERLTVSAEDALIRLALRNGKSVIVDDTNLNPVHMKRFEKIVSEFPDAILEVRCFDTDIDECIARDQKRDKAVGEMVIQGMRERFLDKNEKKPNK